MYINVSDFRRGYSTSQGSDINMDFHPMVELKFVIIEVHLISKTTQIQISSTRYWEVMFNSANKNLINNYSHTSDFLSLVLMIKSCLYFLCFFIIRCLNTPCQCINTPRYNSI